MKALAICPKGLEIDRERLYSAIGLEVELTIIQPSLLSAFTAMSVASETAKHDISTVVAVRHKDAMAAISARKVSKQQIDRVICLVEPNSDVPKRLPDALREGVDMWIFPSQRMLDAYPGLLKNALVAQPMAEEIEHAHDTRRYIWLGAIDGNTERLKQAIEAINAAEEETTLIICGQGKAQNIMPCVRLARGIEHPERIVWAEQDADPKALAATCDAVIQAGADPVADEFILGQPIYDLAYLKKP